MITPSATATRTANGWPLSSVMPPMGALTGAPASARAHARAVLSGWRVGELLIEDCETIVSELVTNALRASTEQGGAARYLDTGQMMTIRVALLGDGRRVLVEVYDQADGQPVMRDATADAETGRGLTMIHVLSDGRWGWHELPDRPGKCVWAVLAQDSER